MDIIPHAGHGYKIKAKNSTVIMEDGKVKIEREKPFVIDAPGEYEVSGISVIGVQVPVGAVYIVEADNMRICILSGVLEKLTESQVEEIGAIDIAVMQELNQEIVKQVDPWVIVTESATNEVQPIAKYSVTSDKLPTETTTVVLERK